jgi:hypothetical protein
METAAPTARFAASADAAPVVLRDVDDLHDADLDDLLAERLPAARRSADRRALDAAAVAAATGLAQLVAQPGRAALMAHDLRSRAALLTVG